MKFLSFITIITMSFKILAVERIENKIINRSNANEIYMTYGRSTVFIFPCNVMSFSDGPTHDIQGILNERNSRMLEIWFSKNNPETQELKVFCQDQNFVFDILPNSRIHQSIFEVDKSYRSRKVHFSKADEIPSEKSKIKIIKVIKTSGL